jgi:hypothetical protein
MIVGIWNFLIGIYLSVDWNLEFNFSNLTFPYVDQNYCKKNQYNSNPL